MYTYKQCALLVILVTFLSVSCSSSTNPINPDVTGPPGNPDSQSESVNQANSGRTILGLWNINVSADRQVIETTPVRISQMHLNVLYFLETICTDCLTLSKVDVINDNQLRVMVRLKHPFPGLMQYTGFDVRGIFIGKSDYTFPDHNVSVAYGDSVPRLLNPDG